jgi:hypothetical protein
VTLGGCIDDDIIGVVDSCRVERRRRRRRRGKASRARQAASNSDRRQERRRRRTLLLPLPRPNDDDDGDRSIDISDERRTLEATRAIGIWDDGSSLVGRGGARRVGRIIFMGGCAAPRGSS